MGYMLLIMVAHEGNIGPDVVVFQEQNPLDVAFVQALPEDFDSSVI